MTDAKSERYLRGNGVELVREREVARRVQRALSRLYALEGDDDVRDFIEPAGAGERETLLVRQSEEGGLEIALRLAPLTDALDGFCQLIEGVSHFVYVAHRAEVERETTQLELEIQAEVDKYVVLAAAIERLDENKSGELRRRLYDDVAFVHGAESERGDRYRVANAVAKRFTRRIEREFVAKNRFGEMQGALRAFFRMGQADKLRAA
ncbi:MAG: hypothetical protein U0235_11600 [Polyangiaceae bacterium]